MSRQWPLPEGSFRISSRFAGRINPVTGARETHSGVDLACPDGTPFYACAGGTIKYIGPASGYGQWIVVDHPASEGGGCSEYGHMWNAFATGLRQGQWVERGQLLGYVGSNGQSTGPHLHLTVWQYAYGGTRIDPETWLASAPYVPVGGGKAGAGTSPETPAGGSMTASFIIDVSEHQDGMSLTQAAREGIVGAICRTTDGTHRDRAYQSHIRDAENGGLVTASYHFLRRPSEGTTVAQQVQASVAVMGALKRPVWLDCETPAGLSVADIREAKRLFEAAGVPVLGAYSYVPWWEGKVTGGEPDSHEFGKFWVAAYPSSSGGTPKAIYDRVGGNTAARWDYPLGNQKPSMWQFTDRASVAGRQVDCSAFRGTKDQLKTLFSGGASSGGDGGMTVSEADRVINYIKAFVGPIGSDVKDVREQITGGRNAGQYPGWSLATVLANARKKGFKGLTMMECQAVLLVGTEDDIKAVRRAAGME